MRAALCSNAGLSDSNANAKAALVDLVKGIVKAVEYTAAVEARPAVPEPDVDGIVT